MAIFDQYNCILPRDREIQESQLKEGATLEAEDESSFGKISKERPIKKRKLVEPVVFEPQTKIQLSRSTYKVNSYIDFKPYKDNFKSFGTYLKKFLFDLGDPTKVLGLYYDEEEKKTQRGERPQTPTLWLCTRSNYECRMQRQFVNLREEAKRIDQILESIHTKFLQAIDHFEGNKRKKGKETLKERNKRFASQLKYLTPEDEVMLQQGADLIEKEFLNKTVNGKRRQKRFGLVSWVLGWGVYRNAKAIGAIKQNIQALYQQNVLQQNQIIELTHYLNLTYGHVSANRFAINEISTKLAAINKTLISTMAELSRTRFTVLVLADIRVILSRLTLGVLTLQDNVNAIYEYLRVLSSRKVNPMILPPDSLRAVLAQVKDDMRRNPRLRLPEDPDESVWNYYSIMKVTPVIMKDFLLIILTIPLIDQTLEMDLYKVHNLPALHPELKIQFTYQLEGEYLAISKDGLYAALPTARDIRICEATEGYLCLMNQALYPVEKIEWCVYAHFEQTSRNIARYCTVDTTRRHANRAQSLNGYMWAISSLKEEKVQIRCLTETTVETIRPPLTILYVGNGCEAFSTSLYIPAKSELTSNDNTLTRHAYLLKFNEDYQDLSRYSLIFELNFEQLTPEELETLPDRLTALPPLNFKELQKRIKPLPATYPFTVSTKVLFAIFMVLLVITLVAIGIGIFWYKRVGSSLTTFQPLARLLLGDSSKDAAKVTPGTSKSGKSQQPLPVVPQKEIELTTEAWQTTLKDYDPAKIRKYQKYLKKSFKTKV